jgi:hypothetical protein
MLRFFNDVFLKFVDGMMFGEKFIVVEFYLGND